MDRRVMALLSRIPEEVILALLTVAGGVAFGFEGADIKLWGVVELSRLGLAAFGVLVVLEIKLAQHKTQKAVAEIEHYSYLHTGGEIWEHAVGLVGKAQKGSTIIGTASNLNSKEFEEVLLAGVEASLFSYHRVFCFPNDEKNSAADEQVESPADRPRPSPDEIKGASRKEMLASYLDFYGRLMEFYKKDMDSGNTSILTVMGLWEEGLEKVRSKNLGPLTIDRHKEHLATDFLILHSPDGRCEEAMLAFPKQIHSSYESGFWTSNHRLAYDIAQNLRRIRSSS